MRRPAPACGSSDHGGARDLQLRTAVVVAFSVSLAGTLPVLLVGATAVVLRDDVGLTEIDLGVGVAAFYGSAALSAVPGGWLVERLGPRRTARLGLAASSASLLSIALIAGSPGSVIFSLAVGGVGLVTAQLAVNSLLVRRVTADRQGMAFGLAQSAFPFAALLAGGSVPLMALTVGWRWTFLLAAAITAIVGVRVPVGVHSKHAESLSASAVRHASLAALTLLAVGMALASAGGTATAAFFTASSVESGFSPANAGVLLAVGSLAGISVRIAGGWLGDRISRDSLLLVAILSALGALGYLGLAVAGSPLVIVLSSILAFGGGWGWPGLLLLALSRTARGTTEMGVVYVGGMSGAVLGPIAFGVVAGQVAYAASWVLMALTAFGAAAAILLSRRMVTEQRS